MIQSLSRKATRSDEDLSKILSTEINISSESVSSTEEGENFCISQTTERYVYEDLEKSYSTHSIENVYFDMDFGSWNAGIFDATHDHFMHSAENGLFVYVANILFEDLQIKNRRVLRIWSNL